MSSLVYAYVGSVKRLMALLLLPILCLCKPLSAQEANGYVAGEVLVGIRADKDDAGLAQRLAFVGADVEQIANLHIHRLRLLPGFTVPTAIAALKLLPDVTYAEPNAYFYGCATPNNPAYANQQYGPQRVQADLA